ncbi:MAG: hypothetical protein BHW01_06290 [Clostridium sp. 27_14]|nr:MAG: hypothetical protein BHW01_06290 [Clostridium sp. 27_14]
MIDKICKFLTNKMREEMPDIDDERAEIINYGLKNIIGEIPKIFIMLGIAYALGVLKLALETFLIILPYRTFSGGFHLKTHIGCIVCTSLMYIGPAYLAQYIEITGIVKIVSIILIWIFGIIMITLYAPADTENVPILRKSERKQKQILSYITLTIALIVAGIIKNEIISNIIIIGYFIQTCTITRIAYKITKNKYGHEVYETAS